MTRSPRPRAAAIVLLSVAMVTVTLPAVAAGPVDDVIEATDVPRGHPARCQLAGFTGVPGCASWVEDWRPDRPFVRPLETATSPDGGTLVETGIVVSDPPFGQAGVTARDAETGELQWSRWDVSLFLRKVEYVYDTVIDAGEDLVYVGGSAIGGTGDARPEGGWLAALSLSDGHTVWERIFDEEIEDLFLGPAGTLYAASEQRVGGSTPGAVWALNPSDGTTQWVEKTGAFALEDVLVPEGGPIVAVTFDARLIALDPETRNVAWRLNLTGPDGERPRLHEVALSPSGQRLATSEVLDCPGPGGTAGLHVVDLEAGTVAWRWESECLASGTLTPPAFAADETTVVMGLGPIEELGQQLARDYRLEAIGFDAETGEEVWRTVRRAPGNPTMYLEPISASPDGGKIYIGGLLTEPRPEERGIVDPVEGVARFGVCAVDDVAEDAPEVWWIWHRYVGNGANCRREPGYAAFVSGFDAETGEALGRVVHQGPFQVEPKAMSVNPVTGQVVATVQAYDSQYEPGFRSIAWPADTWEGPVPGPLPP